MKISYLVDVPEAIPIIAGWLFSEWGQYREGNSLEKIRGRLELNLNKETLPIIIVATINKTSVGTASLRQSDGIENRPTLSQHVPWLASVYVPTEHRKQRIASKLVNYIADIAQAQGHKKLYLRTEDKVTFYQKLGWTTIETLNTESGITTVMYKNLGVDESIST